MSDIIAIYGNSGSGKDTIATLIQSNTMHTLPEEYKIGRLEIENGIKPERKLMLQEYSYWKNVKIGEIPKQVYSIMYSVDREILENRDYKNSYQERFNMTGNEHFIYFAENMKKIFGENLWIDLFLEKYIRTGSQEHSKYIITDLRFPNEYEKLKEMGAIFLRVHRDNNIEWKQKNDGLLDGYHFDYDIYNNWSVYSLTGEVFKFIKQFVLNKKSYNER